MSRKLTMTKRDKTLCRAFGIRSNIKIILVQLKVHDNQCEIDTRTKGRLYLANKWMSSKLTLNAKNSVKAEAHQKLFICSYDQCKVTCRSNYFLQIHIRTHTGEQPFKCPHCEHISAQKSGLTNHINARHLKIPQPKKFSCKFCSKCFVKKQQLNSHMWRHTGEKPFFCQLCKKGSVTNEANQIHELTCQFVQRSGEADNYWEQGINRSTAMKCNQCDYLSTNKHDFRKHLMQHTLTTPFQCTICNGTQCSHRIHLQTNFGEKKYKCSHCNFVTAYRTHLPGHILRMHTKEGSEKKFKCQFCPKSFYLLRLLQSHLNVHTHETFYTCQFCETGFKCGPGRRVHERFCASNPNHLRNYKPFKCTACDYASIKKIYLKNHMRTHTGEKPHACALCNYRCTLKGALSNHMRIHTGEKPFKCSKCEFRCTSSSNLIIHFRRHTGDKPYKCSYCSYAFGSSSHLKRHLQVHRTAT